MQRHGGIFNRLLLSRKKNQSENYNTVWLQLYYIWKGQSCGEDTQYSTCHQGNGRGTGLKRWSTADVLGCYIWCCSDRDRKVHLRSPIESYSIQWNFTCGNLKRHLRGHGKPRKKCLLSEKNQNYKYMRLHHWRSRWVEAAYLRSFGNESSL